jgi:hypothetical protein
MSPSAERQRSFAAALLDPSMPAPAGLIGPDGEPCPKRFAVYRNNVIVGLTEVLAESFPAVRRLVGPEFFQAMAGLYVRRDPPRSPILLDYGAGFADFIAEFEPAAGLLYLTDVARLERAWIEAYHASEVEPLDPGAFADVPPHLLGELRIRLHPSARIIRSKHPAITIWRMNIEGCAPGPVNLAGGEDALIIRPQGDVLIHPLPPGGAQFIGELGRGVTVAEAFEAALTTAPGFDLTANLAGLLQSGAVVGFELLEATELLEANA